jgi:SAM-dependent methyltransferase
MTETKRARDRAAMPAGTGTVLDRRSLSDSHRQLAFLLRPGMKVLDVGCGTGALTADAADVIGAEGIAVGSDINQTLLLQAVKRRQRRSQLHIVQADIFAMPFGRVFDIVTAARVLQWVAHPREALSAMSRAVRPGGILLVLDYDHEQIAWTPLPPQSMRRFYSTFLAWRANAGFDNGIAGRLPALFERVGAIDVIVTPQPERSQRDDSDFMTRAGIWADVAATRGHQMVKDGVMSEAERDAAERDYRAWVAADAQSMTLHLAAVQGIIQDPS